MAKSAKYGATNYYDSTWSYGYCSSDSTGSGKGPYDYETTEGYYDKKQCCIIYYIKGFKKS